MFIAGADIKEMVGPPREEAVMRRMARRGLDIIAGFEKLPFPTVAAIDVPNMVVTLKSANGQTWPVKARSKANIQKLAVGDRIDIRATKSLAVEVTAATARK